MEQFLRHVFLNAESYTVILLWTLMPLVGIWGFYRYFRWSQEPPLELKEGKDAKDRRAA